MLLMNSKNCVAWTIGDGRFLYQVLLGDLGADVAAFREAFGAHDRQRDVMAHACGCFSVEEVAG
jgi:hypothetical protein